MYVIWFEVFHTANRNVCLHKMEKNERALMFSTEFSALVVGNGWKKGWVIIAIRARILDSFLLVTLTVWLAAVVLLLPPPTVIVVVVAVFYHHFPFCSHFADL